MVLFTKMKCLICSTQQYDLAQICTFSDVHTTLQITHSKKEFSLYFLCISFGLQKKYFFKERKKLLDSETRHFEQVFFLLHLALSTKGVNGNWADYKGCIEIACNLAPKAWAKWRLNIFFWSTYSTKSLEIYQTHASGLLHLHKN